METKENKLGGKDGGNYSATGSSAHYKSDLIEFIDNIERMHGTVVAYLVCESNVIKYRGRAGKKAGVPADKDLIKSTWYEKCAEHLKEKIADKNAFNHEGRPYIYAPNQVKMLFDDSECISSISFRGLGNIVDEKLKS